MHQNASRKLHLVISRRLFALDWRAKRPCSDGVGASLLVAPFHGRRCGARVSDLIGITELETIMERTVIAIDIAKKVFQLHWVDTDTGCIERLQMKRAKLLEWFANRTASHVVMEACGGAHDWARTLSGCSHEVRLISPRKVRPFVQRNKTDSADAQAIWTASHRPGMRFVPVKTEAQQVVLSLHRLRAQLMKTRIMQTNDASWAALRVRHRTA